MLYRYHFVISNLRQLDLSFFFFNDTATTEIYPLSLHDALPIWPSTASPSVWWATRTKRRTWSRTPFARPGRAESGSIHLSPPVPRSSRTPSPSSPNRETPAAHSPLPRTPRRTYLA